MQRHVISVPITPGTRQQKQWLRSCRVNRRPRIWLPASLSPLPDSFPKGAELDEVRPSLCSHLVRLFTDNDWWHAVIFQYLQVRMLEKEILVERKNGEVCLTKSTQSFRRFLTSRPIRNELLGTKQKQSKGKGFHAHFTSWNLWFISGTDRGEMLW